MLTDVQKKRTRSMWRYLPKLSLAFSTYGMIRPILVFPPKILPKSSNSTYRPIVRKIRYIYVQWKHMIDICEESSYQFTVHYLITHIVHQTLLQLLQVKEKLAWKLTKVPLEAQPKWYQVEHLSQETMSSNRFGKSHLAFHSFLMERLTLVFFKFNVTFDLTGFIFGNGENCLSSMHFRRWLRMTLVSKWTLFFPFQPLKQNSVINAMAKTPVIWVGLLLNFMNFDRYNVFVFSINPWHLNR